MLLKGIRAFFNCCSRRPDQLEAENEGASAGLIRFERVSDIFSTTTSRDLESPIRILF